MSGIHVQLIDDKIHYRPGDILEGVVFWDLPEPPASVELRLFWATQGKGTQDVEVVHVEKFDRAEKQDRRPFRIDLPIGPYSVSGKLVSVVWGVEVVTPAGSAGTALLVLSPTGEEVRLDRGEGKKP